MRNSKSSPDAQITRAQPSQKPLARRARAKISSSRSAVQQAVYSSARREVSRKPRGGQKIPKMNIRMQARDRVGEIASLREKQSQPREPLLLSHAFISRAAAAGCAADENYSPDPAIPRYGDERLCIHIESAPPRARALSARARCSAQTLQRRIYAER